MIGDVDPSEIYAGGKIAEESEIKELDAVNLYPGVKKTVDEFKGQLATMLR